MTEQGLTDKQRMFVLEYLKCWNATRAAIKAGYPKRSARAMGYENLTKPYIREEINKHLAGKVMEADEVLARLAEHARGDLSVFINENGYADLSSEEAREKFYLLKKVKVKQHKEGRGEDAIVVDEIEIELHDPQAALVHIGRHFKLFTDNMEVDDKRHGKYLEALNTFMEQSNPKSTKEDTQNENETTDRQS